MLVKLCGCVASAISRRQFHSKLPVPLAPQLSLDLRYKTCLSDVSVLIGFHNSAFWSVVNFFNDLLSVTKRSFLVEGLGDHIYPARPWREIKIFLLINWRFHGFPCQKCSCICIRPKYAFFALPSWIKYPKTMAKIGVVIGLHHCH